MNLTLGQKVVFHAKAVRQEKELPGIKTRFARFWGRDIDRPVLGKDSAKQYPKEGVVVGKRVLKEGELIWSSGEWDYSGHYDFKQTGSYSVYLIAYDMRKKPVYVFPEDVERLPPDLELG